MAPRWRDLGRLLNSHTPDSKGSMDCTYIQRQQRRRRRPRRRRRRRWRRRRRQFALTSNDALEKGSPRSRKFPRNFRGFRTLFQVFGRVRIRSDAFGHVASIRMHRDALRCIKMQSDSFGDFRNFVEFFAVLRCFSSLGDYFY